MKVVIFTTQATAAALELLLTRANGLPADGSGVASQKVGDGVAGLSPSLFLTRSYCQVRKHPTDAKWAVSVRDRDIALLTSAQAEARLVPARLTQTQYDNLKTKLLSAVELPAGWFRSTI
jgi:hypothetical protein